LGTTAKEIAKMLHVSPSAVSLALNGKPGVSDSTRKLIIDTAKEYDYTVRNSYNSPAPIRNISYVIYVGEGLVVNEIAFHSIVFQGVEAQAKKLGYNVLVSYLYSKQDEERQLSALFQNTMGVILLGTEFEESSSWLTEHYHIHNSDVPLVMVDNITFNMEIDCICTDNFRGAYKAINYLFSQGHRKIGYFSSANRILNFDERKAGVSRAMDEHPDCTLTIVPVGFSTENAYQDVREWLEKENDLPTAFFTDSDVIAFGAIRAFQRSGYRIPEDISIIGFDDMPACSIINPSLTTIKVAKELLGIKAMEMLHQRITEKVDPDTPECSGVFHTRLSTDVIERHSVSIPCGHS